MPQWLCSSFNSSFKYSLWSSPLCCQQLYKSLLKSDWFFVFGNKNGNFIWLQSANLSEMVGEKIVCHLYRNLWWWGWVGWWGVGMENTVISIFAVPSGITLPLYFLLSQSCFLEQTTQILDCIFRWEERELRVKMHALPKSFWQLFWQKNLFKNKCISCDDNIVLECNKTLDRQNSCTTHIYVKMS